MHFSSKNFSLRKKRAASERGRRMAAARWANERRRQEELAEKDPAFSGIEIARRIVVIDRERTVREVTIYAHDSARSARAKLKNVLSFQP